MMGTGSRGLKTRKSRKRQAGRQADRQTDPTSGPRRLVPNENFLFQPEPLGRLDRAGLAKSSLAARVLLPWSAELGGAGHLVWAAAEVRSRDKQPP